MSYINELGKMILSHYDSLVAFNETLKRLCGKLKIVQKRLPDQYFIEKAVLLEREFIKMTYDIKRNAGIIQQVFQKDQPLDWAVVVKGLSDKLGDTFNQKPAEVINNFLEFENFYSIGIKNKSNSDYLTIISKQLGLEMPYFLNYEQMSCYTKIFKNYTDNERIR